MTATIIANNGAGSTSPVLVIGYDTERPIRNIVHDLIGGDIAAVLAPARPRAGDLQLLYTDGTPPSGYAWVDGYYVPAIPGVESEAWAAFNLHAEATTFTLTETERPEVGMSYVVVGNPRLTLDSQTRNAWVVTVPYQEVQL